MIDTHAHLDACDEPPMLLLDRARAAGVTRVITIGAGLTSARWALELASETEGVFAALAVHPHDANGPDASRLGELCRLFEHEKAVAVGETGLDYVRKHAPPAEQRKLFEAQLELAADIGRPVVVHTRGAANDTARALAGFPGTVVLHCFSEPELLAVALERRYYLSFAGNVTYPRAHALREAAAAVPADRILAETDSPYLAPQPERGKANEPAFVAHTVRALAHTRGEDPAELGRRIAVNASEAFRLP